MAKARRNPLAQRRMREADRERYGTPEWVDVERGVEALNDLDYDGLCSIEDQLVAEVGAESLMRYLAVEFPKITQPTERVRLWLGLLATGADIRLADFKPATFNLDARARPVDAVPPAVTSESSPASTETTTPGSETSTSGSIPGSAAASTE